MKYFGFAIADSMFPTECSVARTPRTAEEVKSLLEQGEVGFCLNPSHTPTIEAAINRFALPLAIPSAAPRVTLGTGDSVIVMTVRGLPRLEGRHEYTSEEISTASFSFGEWTVQ